MPEIKPLGRLRTAALVLVELAVGVMVIAFALELYLVTAFVRGSSVFDISETTDLVYRLTGFTFLLQLALFIVAGVVVMMLMYRMTSNGARLLPSEATHAAHWAVTGWIIPFISLVRPVQMVNQIWKTSASSDPESRESPVPGVVIVWWGLFIVSSITWFATPVAPAVGPTMGELANEAIGQAVSALLEVVAGVAFLVVLRALIRRHERAIEAPWIATARASS